jgi:hypothetical protein
LRQPSTVEQTYGVVLVRGRRSVEAADADEAVADHRGDSSRFEVELGRTGDSALRPRTKLTTQARRAPSAAAPGDG